jgi:hypothetical protein
MMLAKDKNLKTHFVPEGLSTSLSKKDLERFYDLMQTTFNLMDMAVENKFLSNQGIKIFHIREFPLKLISNFDNFDEWMENEIEMDLDEDPEEKKEYERLAKTYFNWKQKGLIDVYEMDIDDILTDVLSKPWKRISSFAHSAGNRIVIILTMF